MLFCRYSHTFVREKKESKIAYVEKMTNMRYGFHRSEKYCSVYTHNIDIFKSGDCSASKNMFPPKIWWQLSFYHRVWILSSCVEECSLVRSDVKALQERQKLLFDFEASFFEVLARSAE